MSKRIETRSIREIRKDFEKLGLGDKAKRESLQRLGELDTLGVPLEPLAKIRVGSTSDTPDEPHHAELERDT